jgi:signal peptidase II
VGDNGAVSSAQRPVEQVHAPVAPRPRRIVLFAAVAVAVLALDIVSKVIIVARLEEHPPVRLLGGALYLVATRNSGAAFSVGTGATIVLTAIALVIVGVILRTASRLRSVPWAVALGLILGGAVGNLADRVFRAPGFARGHVVDWISLFSNDGSKFAIFNVADSAITCGAILTAVMALLGVGLDGVRGGKSTTESSG